MTVLVSSSAELRKALVSFKGRGDDCLAEVRVFGGSIHTWPFSFPKCSVKNLVTGLTFDASEIFSVKPEEVEIAYQVFDAEGTKIQGICSAMRRTDILAYRDCFQRSPFVPVSLTASAMSAALDIVKEFAPQGSDYCVINFVRKNVVNMTVFAEHQPVLLRELNDISDGDLENKIHDTIRYAQSHSQSKQINHVFFTGDLKGKESIVKHMKALEAPVTNGVMNVPKVHAPNLLGHYALNGQQRSTLIQAGSFILIALAMAGIFLSWHFFNTQNQLGKARKAFSVNEYQKAVNLKEQLRQMGHAQ